MVTSEPVRNGEDDEERGGVVAPPSMRLAGWLGRKKESGREPKDFSLGLSAQSCLGGRCLNVIRVCRTFLG